MKIAHIGRMILIPCLLNISYASGALCAEGDKIIEIDALKILASKPGPYLDQHSSTVYSERLILAPSTPIYYGPTKKNNDVSIEDKLSQIGAIIDTIGANFARKSAIDLARERAARAFHDDPARQVYGFTITSFVSDQNTLARESWLQPTAYQIHELVGSLPDDVAFSVLHRPNELINGNLIGTINETENLYLTKTGDIVRIYNGAIDNIIKRQNRYSGDDYKNEMLKRQQNDESYNRQKIYYDETIEKAKAAAEIAQKAAADAAGKEQREAEAKAKADREKAEEARKKAEDDRKKADDDHKREVDERAARDRDSARMSELRQKGNLDADEQKEYDSLVEKAQKIYNTARLTYFDKNGEPRLDFGPPCPYCRKSNISNLKSESLAVNYSLQAGMGERSGEVLVHFKGGEHPVISIKNGISVFGADGLSPGQFFTIDQIKR